MPRPSLERIYPGINLDKVDADDETLRIHLERYQFAAKVVLPGETLDLACGAGYGSYLMATKRNDIQITAVDIDEEALQYARSNYSHPQINFLASDAMKFQAGTPIQNIVSLETIEHLPEPSKFVAHLSGQLAPGGRFIASAPVTPSMDANPFHLHDFTTRSFKKLFLAAGLKEVESFIQVQRYKPFSVIKGNERQTRKGLMRYYLSHPGKFFLRVRSVFRDGFRNKYCVVVFEKK